MQYVFSSSWKVSKEHGGELSKGKRKTARPLCSRRPIHLVMRASAAQGAQSFQSWRHVVGVRQTVQRVSRKHGVRLYRYANSGNHLHLLIRIRGRRFFRAFLRELAGAIAMRVTGSRKGKPLGRGFWDLPPFTRIVEWGKDFRSVCKYLLQNALEGAGLVPYRPRGKRHSTGTTSTSSDTGPH